MIQLPGVGTVHKCAKHPTKTLAKKTVATKTEEKGKHLIVVQEKDALVCETCGVVAWLEPVASTNLMQNMSSLTGSAPFYGSTSNAA